MAPFRFPITVRYLEVDQQGVVFNMWYLAWFDEAMTAFLDTQGPTYAEMMAAGFDVQLVRSEIDWSTGLGFGDDVHIDVAVDNIGTTSFRLRFDVCRGDDVTAVGRTTYVVIATDGSGKKEIPPQLRATLEGATTVIP
jgi:acyl-CoA thioester hydrolase